MNRVMSSASELDLEIENFMRSRTERPKNKIDHMQEGSKRTGLMFVTLVLQRSPE